MYVWNTSKKLATNIMAPNGGRRSRRRRSLLFGVRYDNIISYGWLWSNIYRKKSLNYSSIHQYSSHRGGGLLKSFHFIDHHQLIGVDQQLFRPSVRGSLID